MVYDIKRTILAVTMALVTAITAQLNFKVGPVPYTMQNFGVMLSGFLLGPWYGAMAMVVYLALIALALPFAAGGGGLGVLVGPTAGFLFGFVISAFLSGWFRRVIWRRGNGREIVLLWLSTLIASLPTYILGFLVFYKFALSSPSLVEWAGRAAETFGINLGTPVAVIFVATVLIFLPQDFFVDHLLAVLVYRYVHAMLRERGVEVD